MSYKENSKAETIILWIITALVLLGLVVLIVVGFTRDGKAKDFSQNIPTDETTESNMTETDIPVITPGTGQGENKPETTEPGYVSVDIIEANQENEKNNQPHIVGDVSILPGVKEVGDETNN